MENGKLMGGMKIVGAVVVLGVIVAACSGGNEGADGTVAAPETSEKVVESTTTTEAEVVPEIAEATRPTLVIPESESYNNSVEEVLDRYTLYRRATYLAAAPPIVDPDYEPLKDLTTGDVAESVQEFLVKWREGNVVQVVEGEDTVTVSPAVITPTFAKAEGSTVIVQDCVIDDSYLQDRSTGEVVDEGLRTSQFTVELIFQDGQWRVHETNTNHKYEGESACPERA